MRLYVEQHDLLNQVRAKYIAFGILGILTIAVLIPYPLQTTLICSVIAVGTFFSLTAERKRIEIAKGIEHGEFYLDYQIIVNSNNANSVKGVEALLRWQHPHYGLISPTNFIPLAEKEDLIIPLTRHVFKLLKADIHRYPSLRELGFVSVNISASHLDTLKTDSQLLLGFSRNIKFEITERMDYGSSNNPTRNFKEGDFFLDDFGSGNHTSIQSLHQYRVSAIKLDKSFTAAICDKGTDAIEKLNAVLDVARERDLLVIAEGVETASERNTLLSLGVHIQQGYLYSHPIAPEELTYRFECQDKKHILIKEGSL